MRLATIALITVGLGACNDLRGFEGVWQGPRVGDSPVLSVGIAPMATASLTIGGIDTNGLRGTLSVDGLATTADVVSIAGAEADVLSGMTFDGSPMRVYLSFVATLDGYGELLAVIALYDDRRVEVRVMRGGQLPVYAIFALTEGP